MNPLEQFAADTQAEKWHELNQALHRAINGVWSIEAADHARRIVEAARLVGPTEHGAVPYRLVAGGVYEAVLTAGQVPVELPDEAEWQRLDELMAKHGTTRSTTAPELAATVATIRTERETNWIAGGRE